MKNILLFCLLIAAHALQSQTVDDFARWRVGMQIGAKSSPMAKGITNRVVTNPAADTLVTSRGVYNWVTGALTFSGDVSGLYNNLVLANSGVTAGTCTNCSLTIDSKGRVTVKGSGSAGATYTAGSGIAIDGSNVISNSAPNVVQTLGLASNTLSLSGGGGSADLSPYVNAAPQTLSYISPNLSLSGGGGTVALPTGTVTSVAWSLPTIFSTSGSPITASGTLTATLASQSANTIFRAGDAGGVPGFSALSTSDIPNLSFTKITGGALSVVANGALSVPAMTGTGTWITGGTATTTKPYLLIEPTGTTSTGWSTTGTGLGVNAPSGFIGNIVDFQTNGSSRFKVSGAGNATVSGAIIAGTGSFTTAVYIASSSNLKSNGSGIIQLGDTPETGFNRLQFGGSTSSFPAVKRNAATAEFVLANDSGFAATQSLYQRFGSGTPEGVVTAPVGAIYHRTDGGANTSFYVKESGTGNTGWVAK